MNLCFKGKTNKNYVKINTIAFLVNEKLLTVDRECTTYTINGDNLYMVWSNVYSWDGSNENDLTESEIKDASLEYVEIEDDADSDYKLTITDWSVNK